MKFKKYITSNNEVLLYVGNPNLDKLDDLAEGPGDLWHSSLSQGFANCFQDIKYQTAVYWWFLNEIENQEHCVSWRLNINAFVVRESVWNQINSVDHQYQSSLVAGLDLGYNMLRNQHGVPLFIQNLYASGDTTIKISTKDRYTFFFKNFKSHHALYMLLRKGLWAFPKELKAYLQTRKQTKKRIEKKILPRELQPIKGTPTVSLVIPTMRRQEYTQFLLEDHKKQTYLIKEAIIVDATPEEDRDDKYYRNEDFPFDVVVKWQTSKGSCRARNEAIDLCTGDYIIFADDDVRIQDDFVENHLRLLQTYNAKACNGLDIMADHVKQDLSDLEHKLAKIENRRWYVGVSSMFSNANSCVHRDLVKKLIGNDINFDGGYGEDSDFGLRILQAGYVLLHNPYSPNLHLKPPQGGYRWWGNEAKKKGKKRKSQPWELDNPVKNIRPVPSPTITYGVLKHYTSSQIKEWRGKHFFLYLFKRNLGSLPLRLVKLPLKQLQFSKSLTYGKALIKLGTRYR